MRLPIMIDYVEIPSGVNISIEDGRIYIKGPKGEKYRNINNRNIIVEIKENKIIFKVYFPSRKIIRDMNTMVAHIKNDIEGVTKGFVYKLKGISIHFPLKLKLQNNKLIIENYMGGRDIKEIEIPKGVKAILNENEITLEGHDIELLGNLAGLIENSVKPREKDLRKFQDGIYIIQKP
jgi:large subunit ribosomal protein L6